MEAGACAGCDRREFLAHATLAAAGLLVVSACGDGPTDPGDNGGSGKLVVALANFPTLAVVGGAARVDGGGSHPVALVRVSANDLVALSMTCPHQGTRVLITTSGFRCPNHGATFDANGKWIGGQATTSMRTVASVYDPAAGTVTIG